MKTFLLAIINALVVIMPNGSRQEFPYEEVLSRALAGEQAFVQAIGQALPERAKTYLEITQMRQGNTTTDAAIERAELGR